MQPQRSGHDESSHQSTNNRTRVDHAICGALLGVMAQKHDSQAKRGVHYYEKYRKRVVIYQGTAPRLVEKSEGTASRELPVGVHVSGSRCNRSCVESRRVMGELLPEPLRTRNVIIATSPQPPYQTQV